MSGNALPSSLCLGKDTTRRPHASRGARLDPDCKPERPTSRRDGQPASADSTHYSNGVQTPPRARSWYQGTSDSCIGEMRSTVASRSRHCFDDGQVCMRRVRRQGRTDIARLVIEPGHDEVRERGAAAQQRSQGPAWPCHQHQEIYIASYAATARSRRRAIAGRAVHTARRQVAER